MWTGKQGNEHWQEPKLGISKTKWDSKVTASIFKFVKIADQDPKELQKQVKTGIKEEA